MQEDLLSVSMVHKLLFLRDHLSQNLNPQERQQQQPPNFIGNPSTTPQGSRPQSSSGPSNVSDPNNVPMIPFPNQQMGMTPISSTTLPPFYLHHCYQRLQM